MASRVGIVRFNTTATSVQIPKDSLSADHYYVAYVSAIVNTPKTPPLSGPQSITRVNATSFSGVFTP